MKTLGLVILMMGLQWTEARREQGRCVDSPLEPNFEPEKYTGVWYETMRDRETQNAKVDCVQANYGINADGSISVVDAYYNKDKDTFGGVSGSIRFDGAKGRIKFPWFPSGNYFVVATDYTSFTIVYNCRSCLLNRHETAWILTREKNPPHEVIVNALKLLKERLPVYQLSDFYITKQGGDCKYPQSPMQMMLQ